MGFGIGLGAFLEGAANGYAFGEGIKDKKRERERDDRLDFGSGILSLCA